jgi:uncharacterized protein HemX
MRRSLIVLLAAATVTCLTTMTAWADYPPTPVVKGTSVTADPTTAFTGSNVMPLLVACLAALVIGAGLLYWSKRPDPQS